MTQLFEVDVEYNDEHLCHQCKITNSDEEFIAFNIDDNLWDDKVLLINLLLKRGLMTAEDFNQIDRDVK